MEYNRGVMDYNTLEDVIRQNIRLDPLTGTGWYPCLCKVCNDRGHKGNRAAFRFSPDQITYHCFNCKHKATFFATDTSMPHKMERVLEAFNVPQDEWKAVLFANLAANDAGKPVHKGPTADKSLDPVIIDLPAKSTQVSASSTNKWSQVAVEYLESRGITAEEYPFYISPYGNWKGRLIIPIYREGKLIFYQGRDMGMGYKNKYKSAPTPAENILYGFDQIYNSREDTPLLVVEGFFDAFVVGGVATLGNEFSPQQLKHLHKTNREKIIVPDRRGDGHVLALQALKQGWSVSLPEIGDCKDLNEATLRYGKLYVIDSILKHTMTGIVAETAIGVYCEKDDTYRGKSGSRK